MQGDFFYRVETALSPDRLSVYRQPGMRDLDVIACYLWNVALSEALYPSLQTLEIALRNSVNRALSSRFGTPYWYDHSGVLDRRELQAVADAKEQLTVARKPHDPGRIIAELSFGFWTSLFNVRYEQADRRLWPQPALSKCIASLAQAGRAGTDGFVAPSFSPRSPSSLSSSPLSRFPITITAAMLASPAVPIIAPLVSFPRAAAVPPVMIAARHTITPQI